MGSLTNGQELIVTRTPLRISFAGGGTDLPAFYRRGYGAVLSSAIDKYLYVTVKRHSPLFDENYRLNYSDTEHVDTLDDIKNSIARECLRMVPVEPPIYISTVADVPASSGLGSSSSFAVGFLNALHVLRGERVSAAQLAQEASHIELEVLEQPIGKQDHYAAAFGGLNYFRFQNDGRVTIEPHVLASEQLQGLFDHILMFSTGTSRGAASVLTEQNRNTDENMEHLLAMRQHAHDLQTMILNGLDAAEFGRLLDSSWQMKRQLASNITNESIDRWYSLALAAGALGGKLCGAGGGGFLLFIVAPERQAVVRQALVGMSELSVKAEPQGSRVLMPYVE